MVIVEFFDKVSLENICGALMCRPERVVFVGPSIEKMERVVERYRTILNKKGIDTDITCVGVSKNNLSAIVDKLSEIAEANKDECIFDLTGGDDLYLVAVGIVMQKYGNRVQCHRFNFLADRLIDCDADGKSVEVTSFDISVEDSISIYGGDVLADSNAEFFTYDWDFNDDFLKDIDAMWEICKKNPKLWNSQISTLAAIFDSFEMESPLSVSFDQQLADDTLYEKRVRYTMLPWIFRDLQKAGVINSLYIDDKVNFEFKNEQVKKCLTVAGQILELFIASRLMAIKDEDGSPLYHDVKVGTVIGWREPENEYDTPSINEIDVIAMKGAIPVFISCKNGYFDVNELYKLNTVADRFGNKYAKKVLVVTDMDKIGPNADFLIARMDDMGIRHVCDLDQMSENELIRILTSLWKN